MAKFCENGHQMEDSWTECPYCVTPGYRGPSAADLGKTRLDVDVTRAEPRATAARPSFDPGKTVPLTSLRRAPVVGWLVALNGAQKGEDFRLREGKNTIGSASGAEVALRDPAVSSRHASISYKEGEFVITDLDSTNGTFLNDDPVPITRLRLHDSDVVRVGETALKFKCL